MSKRTARKRKEKATSACNAWPRYSDNLGVHTSQIPEARAHYASLGINVDFHPQTGAMKLDSRKQQKRVCEASDYYVVSAENRKQGSAADGDPVRLSNRERDNRGYNDTQRLQIPPGQARYSANWHLAFGKGKYD